MLGRGLPPLISEDEMEKHKKRLIQQLFLIPLAVRQQAESFVSLSLFLSVVHMVKVTLTSGHDVIRYKKPASPHVIDSIFS